MLVFKNNNIKTIFEQASSIRVPPEKGQQMSDQIILVVIGSIFTAIGALGLYILNDLKKSVTEATANISTLSGQFLVVVERGERHELEIEKIKATQESVRERFHGLGNDLNAIRAKIEMCATMKGKQ